MFYVSKVNYLLSASFTGTILCIHKSTSFFQKLHITNIFLLSLHVVQVFLPPGWAWNAIFDTMRKLVPLCSALPVVPCSSPPFTLCSADPAQKGLSPFNLTFLRLLLLVKMKIMVIRANERFGKTEIHLQLQCQLMPHRNTHFKSFENLFFPLYCFSPLVDIPTINGRVALAHCDIVPGSARSSAQNAFLPVLWEASIHCLNKSSSST